MIVLVEGDAEREIDELELRVGDLVETSRLPRPLYEGRLGDAFDDPRLFLVTKIERGKMTVHWLSSPHHSKPEDRLRRAVHYTHELDECRVRVLGR